MDVRVRRAPGVLGGIEADRQIYHRYIRTSPATFEVEPRTEAAWRAWFEGFDMRGRHRLLVAREDDA